MERYRCAEIRSALRQDAACTAGMDDASTAFYAGVMKMAVANEAPVDGVVTAVHVSEGRAGRDMEQRVGGIG